MSRFLFLSALLAFMIAPARAELRSTMIPSRDIFEECFELKQGDVLEYEYSSPVKLIFNVHYHKGKEVTYLEQQRIEKFSGAVMAPEDNEYCLMWENKNFSESALEYDYRSNADGMAPADHPH